MPSHQHYSGSHFFMSAIGCHSPQWADHCYDNHIMSVNKQCLINKPTCCSSSLLPLRSDRSEPGALGYMPHGVDGSLEYEPPEDTDIDRVGLLIDCGKAAIINPLPLSIGLSGD